MRPHPILPGLPRLCLLLLLLLLLGSSQWARAQEAAADGAAAKLERSMGATAENDRSALEEEFLLNAESDDHAGEVERPDLERDAKAPIPGEEKQQKKEDSNLGNAEEANEKAATNLFAAAAIDADRLVESDFAVAEDVRDAQEALRALLEDAPLTAARDISRAEQEGLLRELQTAAFESNKSSLVLDALGGAATRLSNAFDVLRNETELFVTEIDEAGADANDRSQEDAESVERARGRIDRASLDIGKAIVALASAAESAHAENGARRKALQAVFATTAKRQYAALDTLEAFEAQSEEIVTHRQRSVQALADELTSVEASLTNEQKTLLGRKVVGSMKEELHAASAEQTAILFRAQLANKNTTVSRFRCAASLDLSRQAMAAIEATLAPEQQFQRALQSLLQAAKQYASMESIYAELAKDGRNATALLLLREGNSPERLAFEAEELEALLVRAKTKSARSNERKMVGDAAHMLSLALSGEREALDAMNAIRTSEEESEGAVDDMASAASASSLDTAVARSDLPTSGGAYNNVTDSSAKSKTDRSLDLEHLLDMAAEGDYGAHLLSRLDPTPWVENGEIQIEDEEEAARGRGEELPHHLPTELKADGTPKGLLPGESGGLKNATSSPMLTTLDEEGKARGEAELSAEEARRDESRAEKAGKVSAALVKALGHGNLSLDAQVLMRSRLVEAQSAHMALLERARAEREAAEGEKFVFEAILLLKDRRKELTDVATAAAAERARAEVEYADAVEEARKHPASAPKKTNATRNTTSNIDNAPGMSNTTAAELVATPLSYKAAQEQLALAESLEAVANATLLVGEAEGNVARKTHDVLASMKSVEESTADLARAENSADDGVGMALDVKVVSNAMAGPGATGAGASSTSATGIEGGDFTESEPVYSEAQDALREAGASLTFGKIVLQKDELRRAEKVEGSDVALAQKLARDTAETADVLHDFFLPENARAGASAQRASAELARERARVLVLGRASRKGASPAAEPSVQQRAAALQAKVAYLNALHRATVGKESQVARGVTRLKQMNERIKAEQEAAGEREQTAGRIQAAWEAPALAQLADRTSFTQRSHSQLLRVGRRKKDAESHS